MNVDLKINTAKLKTRMDRAGADLDKKIRQGLSITAQEGTNVILNMLNKGKGYRGPFLPYSPAYLKWKTSPKGGRARSSVVNLQLTNYMVESMFVPPVSGKTAYIKFSNPVAAGRAAFNNVKRPFFGFNNYQKKYLAKFFFEELTK